MGKVVLHSFLWLGLIHVLRFTQERATLPCLDWDEEKRCAPRPLPALVPDPLPPAPAPVAQVLGAAAAAHLSPLVVAAAAPRPPLLLLPSAAGTAESPAWCDATAEGCIHITTD